MSRRHRRPPSLPPASPGPSPGPASPAQTIWLPAVIIATAALLAYANTFSAPFVFDDLRAISGNPTIRHLWPPWEALSPPESGGGAAGRPLVNLSLAINYALGGGRVEGYHALNLLIHLAAGLALFGLVRRTLLQPVLQARWGVAARPVAFFTALLWTVHPLLTESVTCVVQRTESLVGLWLLLMLYCLVRAAETAGPSRWLIGAFTACLLGMLTKEVMVVAPVLAVFFHVALVDGSWRAAWARRGKFFALLALTWVPLALLVAQNSTRHGAAGFGQGVAWWEYALTQCRAIILYLKLSFWPHPLVLDHGDGIVRSLREVWPQALLLGALLATTAVAWFRKMSAAFAGVWFFAILAPSSSVVPLVTQTIAEHRMYLPLAAVILLVVTGAYALAGRRSLWIFTALAVVLAGLTVRRNDAYRTTLGLWRVTVAQVPGNARAHNNLGTALENAREEDEAIHEYERALRLKPDYAMAHFNLAYLLVRRDRLAEAITHYEESRRLAPEVAKTHTNLGIAYARQGRRTEAQQEFATALRLAPDDFRAHNSLGNVLMSLDRPAEAVVHYAAALQLSPDPAIDFNLATALAAAGRIPEAITRLQSIIRQAPGRAEAHGHLGVLLAQTGRRDEAIAELREALRLKPGFSQARAELARLGYAPPAP